MLSGKVAGVSVISNDGAPGSGAQIRIRGGSSLNASNDPLLVIDGLAIDNQGIKGMSNGLSMVNPEDIETFTVLKMLLQQLSTVHVHPTVSLSSLPKKERTDKRRK